MRFDAIMAHASRPTSGVTLPMTVAMDQMNLQIAVNDCGTAYYKYCIFS